MMVRSCLLLAGTALAFAVDTLEAAVKQHPRQDHRAVIVHFGFTTDSQVDRAARLGAIISTNPYYVTAKSIR